MSTALTRMPAVLQIFTLVVSFQACAHSRTQSVKSDPSASLNEPMKCGQPLARDQVIAVVRQAMQILWGDSSLGGFQVKIEEQGCDYRFSALRTGTEAVEDISFTIDRSGRIKSLPHCWWLGELGNCPSSVPPPTT
jgi:hypothetical protein